MPSLGGKGSCNGLGQVLVVRGRFILKFLHGEHLTEQRIFPPTFWFNPCCSPKRAPNEHYYPLFTSWETKPPREQLDSTYWRGGLEHWGLASENKDSLRRYYSLSHSREVGISLGELTAIWPLEPVVLGFEVLLCYTLAEWPWPGQ